MSLRKWISVHIHILISVTYLIGCVSDDGIPIGSSAFPTDAEVFIDQYGSGVGYQAFAGSKVDAVQIEFTETFSGTQGLAIIVPDSNDASGSYSGGAFTTNLPRDLRGYNALTFYAKASRTVTFDVIGLGNDNTGTSIHTCEVSSVPLTTTWQKVIIPIPDPAKLSAEQGLFYFAEGPEGGVGCTIYIDEIVFENLTTITNIRPSLPSQTVTVEQGDPIVLQNSSVIFDVNGTDVTVSAMAAYFDYESSDSSVVTINNGTITAVSAGSATLTGSLAGITATGSIPVTVTGTLSSPTTEAPTPTLDSADVVAVYSDYYPGTTIDTWSADWDMADVEDFIINSDNTKKYSNLSFAGIDFSSSQVDASAMTHFHIDMWTPYPTSVPTSFKVKIVDFGANGVYDDGGDDREHELSFTEATIPGISSETWVGIDVPLSAFTNLTSTGNIAQMIISGDLPIVYIDNIYFYNAGVQTAPTVSAPIPTVSSDSVVSLLSDAYTNISVDTWSIIWDQADVADFAIGSDSMKQYTNLTFAAIDFRSNPIDASLMTHFHIDLWTADAITSQAFKVKLIDFGLDSAQGGGDDVEHELSFGQSDIVSALWTGLDLPLSDFTGLTTKNNIYQIIISGDISTVFIDNMYFYDSGIPTEPLTSAPTPTHNAADVLSLFSEAYTNVPVDTWSAPWDSAGVSDFIINGTDTVKKYVDLLFAGIELPTLDASTMTHFHMDVWTPDATAAPSEFRIKIVDYGPNGVWDGGGDDTEHELTLDETVMDSNVWVSLDIPLTDFVNLTTTGHIAQLIISGTPNTVYIDNVYFHK